MPFTGTHLLLNNRCTIKGYSSTKNAYNEVIKTPVERATEVPCRLMNARGKQLQKENQVVVADYLLYLPFGQDVKEGYTLHLGTRSFDVLFVDPNPGNSSHHVECLLKEIRSAV